jgi:hypothetical protein
MRVSVSFQLKITGSQGCERALQQGLEHQFDSLAPIGPGFEGVTLLGGVGIQDGAEGADAGLGVSAHSALGPALFDRIGAILQHADSKRFCGFAGLADAHVCVRTKGETPHASFRVATAKNPCAAAIFCLPAGRGQS